MKQDIKKAYVVFDFEKEYPNAKDDYAKWLNERLNDYEPFESLEDAKCHIEYLIERAFEETELLNFFDEYQFIVNTFLYDYENDLYVDFLDEEVYTKSFSASERSNEFDRDFIREVDNYYTPDPYDELRDYLACNH